MSCSAMTEHYEEITVCGKPALFTNFRIKRDTVPDSLYVSTKRRTGTMTHLEEQRKIKSLV